ncbi:hypothetical protein IWQ62_002627 [Dispira parvispora]|uniref:Carbonic anhydrase n=1 Tax=Dispira parvispora TaxID=1520584 RepID=A0A9W8E7A3_9FUNG|nr:hypothetical protein IWQ62_002627 [Dispira parvispora]
MVKRNLVLSLAYLVSVWCTLSLGQLQDQSGEMDMANEFLERNEVFAENVAEHVQLANVIESTQDPKVALIGCIDSRVIPEYTIRATFGEVVTYRNVGNIVRKDQLDVKAFIQFALSQPNLKTIIVAGHTDCGGMKGIMRDSNGALGKYLEPVKDLYTSRKEYLDDIPKKDALRMLSVLNVRRSVNNLRVSPEVMAHEGNVKIHGWVFDLTTRKYTDVTKPSSFSRRPRL